MNAILEESRKISDAQDWPSVSVIMPVFNEEKFIGRVLGAVLEQDYPAGKLEVIVADGMSTDRTADLVRRIGRRFANVRLIHNPGRIVPCGLNLAIAAARGEVIVRMDGHCEYPRDYLRRVVELRRRTAAVNAGGVLVPMGSGFVQESVAQAYYSPVGLGGAALRGFSPDGEAVREVDAVHGGCWERERLLTAGGFDETMVRNQDDELSFRLRKASGRIVQSNAIRVKYHVRDSFKKLFLQFAQYGYWKVRVVRKHPHQASVRHFLPGVFALSILVAALAALILKPAMWALAMMLGGYFSALVLASLSQLGNSKLRLLPGVVMALAMMHFGYGLGFLFGWTPSSKIFRRSSR